MLAVNGSPTKSGKIVCYSDNFVVLVGNKTGIVNIFEIIAAQLFMQWEYFHNRLFHKVGFYIIVFFYWYRHGSEFYFSKFIWIIKYFYTFCFYGIDVWLTCVFVVMLTLPMSRVNDNQLNDVIFDQRSDE